MIEDTFPSVAIFRHTFFYVLFFLNSKWFLFCSLCSLKKCAVLRYNKLKCTIYAAACYIHILYKAKYLTLTHEQTHEQKMSCWFKLFENMAWRKFFVWNKTYTFIILWYFCFNVFAERFVLNWQYLPIKLNLGPYLSTPK